MHKEGLYTRCRGREEEKQKREKRKEDERHAKVKKEIRDATQNLMQSIAYQENSMDRVQEGRRTFTSKPEQELQRLLNELSTREFNTIREDLFSEDEYYELLTSIMKDGYSILLFLGVGFNRAAFLVESPHGQRLVAKIPIRMDGFSNNTEEVRIFQHAKEQNLQHFLARTVYAPEKTYILQEVCRPIPKNNIKEEQWNAIREAAEKLNFQDIQCGISCEDGKVKIYDFAYTTSL